MGLSTLPVRSLLGIAMETVFVGLFFGVLWTVEMNEHYRLMLHARLGQILRTINKSNYM